MSTSNGSGPPVAVWQRPREEDYPLSRYAETLRERLGLILAVLLLTTAAALVYVVVAEKVYEAETELLVTPISSDDPALAGLGVIRESSDPTRDVETAAQLVTNVDVARRVARGLGLSDSPSELLERVAVEPVAQSNVVTITAEADSPERAAALANGFASATVADRTEQLRGQLDSSIARLRRTVRDLPRGQTTTDQSPASQLAALEALRGGDDPTISVETAAEAPTEPVRPKPLLSIAAGVLAGLVLGLGAAFGLQVLDPRLRREKQLRDLYNLPILARVPNAAGPMQQSGPLTLQRLGPPAAEAYRTLRATIAASRGGRTGPRSILVTSASQSEGKTTTAINLAASLALAGNRVILIEADLRRPAVGEALGESAELGTGSVLVEQSALEESLITANAYGKYLRLLLAEGSGYASGWMADHLFLPNARQLIDHAKALADYVVIDSPPLSEVIDALPLAQKADEVVVVVRRAKTHLTKLIQLGELLARHGVTPTGFVFVGVKTPGKTGYYYAPGPARGKKWRSQTPKGGSPAPARGSSAARAVSVGQDDARSTR